MNLSTYTTAQLVTAFNVATGRDIKKFENRRIAELRVAQVFEHGSMSIDAVLGLTGDKAQPAPTVTKETAVPKKTHAADDAAAAIIAGAVSYNVHMRVGPAKKINEAAATLAEAAKIALRLELDNAGKRAMVYAIDASGASALVPVEALSAASTPAIADAGIATDDEVPAFLRKGRVSEVVATVVPPAADKPAKPAREKKAKPARAEGASTRTRREMTAKIVEVVANPKKPGSRSFKRFELYKAGSTLQDFIDACFKAGYPESEAKADISWDARKGFIKIG